jgi:hypothetical protein
MLLRRTAVVISATQVLARLRRQVVAKTPHRPPMYIVNLYNLSDCPL